MTKMKSVLLALMLLLGLAGLNVSAQEMEFPRPSPNAGLSQDIGTTVMTIKYCRPGVKGREIWGGLVAYGELWRAGANEATVFTFSDPVMIEGKELPAGSYSFFAIPEPDKWTLVFNNNTGLWGTGGYQEAEDALRIMAKPMSGDFVERMRFVVNDVTDNSAVVELQWEKVRVPFTVTVNTTGKVMKQAQQAMGRYWVMPYRAANYCFESGNNLEKGLEWVNLSIANQKTYWNMLLKARLQEKMGQKDDAVATLREAIAMGKSADQPPYNLADMEKMLAEWTR
ncbi:MAG: DUF2911 domain-containing protein [Acidobacteria bacterium]|nr:DUF2911 domain-containing protein [Acidobacteriota bacterium]